MGEDTSGFCGDKLADIRNKKIGFNFQDFYLMDSLDAFEYSVNSFYENLINARR